MLLTDRNDHMYRIKFVPFQHTTGEAEDGTVKFEHSSSDN